jgi:hypothetical protein
VDGRPPRTLGWETALAAFLDFFLPLLSLMRCKTCGKPSRKSHSTGYSGRAEDGRLTLTSKNIAPRLTL